jgi:hypothetical protein
LVLLQSTFAVVRVLPEISALPTPAVNAAGVTVSSPNILTSGSSSAVDVKLIIKCASVMTLPAGILIPLKTQPFQMFASSQLARGLLVIDTVAAAVSSASSALAPIAIGPIVVGIYNVLSKRT